MYKWLILLLAAASIVLIGVNAMAVGVGGYVDIGGGGHFYDVKTNDLTKPGEASFVNVMGGFILDTNTGGPEIFNYRMKIGGGSFVEYKREMDLKISKIDMEHTFGFGIVRKEMVRFWLGPSIGINIQWGKSESTRRYFGALKINQYINWQYDPSPITGSVFPLLPPGIIIGSLYYPFFDLGVFQDKIKKIQFYGGSIGITAGVNINVVKHLGIGLELGFKYDLTGGTQKREVYNVLWNNPYGKFSDKLFVHGWNLFGSLSLMYRFGE